MAVTTKKQFPATTNATTTVFSPVSIQLNNQDDLDVYVTLSGGTRVLQLRQSTGSTAQSSHSQVNDTTGLYFPAVSAGTTLYNYQLSTDNNTITFNSALPQGAVVSCERRTRDADSSYTTFASGSTIRATDLNNSSTESNFTAQDGRNKAFDLEGKLFNGPADGSIKTKLDGIEANATQDQTASEIRALVESASDSNVFTDADHSKLNAIEAGATADQTASEIKALYEDSGNSNASYIKTQYESNSNTNGYTDAEKTKLTGIETGATADQTAAEIRTLVESATDSNVFTDADHTKLNGIAAGADVTSTNSINALTDVNTAGVSDGKILKYDSSVSKFVIADDGGGGGGGGSSTFTGLSDTPANFGSSAGKVLKVNSGETALEFSDADVVADTTPQLGGNLDVQAREINTSTTNGNIKLGPNGTGVVEVKGNTNAGTLQLNCENNSHGVKIKSPAHSNNADYTVTLFNQDPSYLQHASFVKIDSSGQLSIDNKIYHEEPSHLNMGAFDITFDNTGGIIFDSATPSTATNNGKVQFFGPTTIANDVSFVVPNVDGPAGTFLKTDGSGNLSFASADVVADTTPQLGGDLDVNGKTIIFDNNNIFLELKTGATNAVVNGVTQHVQQGSLIIDGGTKDLFLTAGTSSGGKITFGSADGATHEVMRITPSVLGASQHGKVDLKYVTANAGGNTSSSTKLSTTSTGINVVGNVVLSNALMPSADSSSDIGTTSVRWRNLYADTLYGDGSNLTGVNPTVANGCIYENSTEISADFTTSTTKNSMSAGPITIANNVTLTIPNNSVYTIV